MAWQRREARNDQDESQLTQMERDLQIARLQMIIFYTTKPLPFPYSAEEAAQLATLAAGIRRLQKSPSAAGDKRPAYASVRFVRATAIVQTSRPPPRGSCHRVLPRNLRANGEREAAYRWIVALDPDMEGLVGRQA